jgi:hypothetical protein
MKRRSNTLYELSRQRLSKEGQQRDHQQTLGDRLQPGASFRMPVGGIIVGAIVLILLLVAAWWIGASGGTQPEVNSGNAGHLQPPGQVVDPLVAATGDGEETQPQAEQRQTGQWYFVLAETRPEGARRLAAYCRQLGLDAAVISGHNTRLDRVIALPGLDSSSSQTVDYQALDGRIRDVGRRWKASGGTTDLSDRYLDRWTQTNEPSP